MAQAVSTDTRSAFVAKLLAPPRKIDTAANRRFLNELRDEAERAWDCVMQRYWAAKAYRDYEAYSRRASQIETRRLDQDRSEQARAHLDLISAVDRLMHVPAPSIRALRHKQKIAGFDGGRKRWNDAIVADEARLTENR